MTVSRSRALLGVILAIACALVASTYSIFGHTWDEPEHLAAGLALVDTGEYPYDFQHPPLARIAMAIGPYLAGARSHHDPGPVGEQEGRDILYGSGHYDLYLTLARVGMLPFLALLLVVTWSWTRHTFGTTEAAVATFFVATTPPILGHAGVAALDIPMAATTMLALYLFVRWFDDPRFLRAIAFGVAAGIATGTKLSAPPFILSAVLAWSMAAWLTRRNSTTDSAPPHTFTLILKHGATAAIVAFFVTVFCYGFRFTTLSPEWPILVPVGVPRLFSSVAMLADHNAGGHLSFFMGDLRRSGWWDFYLVALGVKTPLPMLLLGVGGLAWLIWRGWRERRWQLFAPSLAFAAMLLFASAYSHINIGVRHVIVLFPLMAIGAGVACVFCWRRSSKPFARAVISLLLVCQVTSLALAHPDDLAYFNLLAGSHPEKILVDSDLDWGQDMRRLENELHERKITEFSLAYRGTADLLRENLPHYKRLWPGDRATGWIAISLLAKETDESHGYDWLNAYQPVMRIGKSIDLYYVETRDTRPETRQN